MLAFGSQHLTHLKNFKAPIDLLLEILFLQYKQKKSAYQQAYQRHKALLYLGLLTHLCLTPI